MAEIHERVLLVEGKTDCFVIAQLMEANGIPWKPKENPPVFIRDCKGYSQLVDSMTISTELKARELKALGLIVDADVDLISRWQSVRNAFLKSIPDLPDKLPDSGLIHITQDGIRFGIWIMPDNQIQGMLESFLAYMIPDLNERLWQYAQNVVKEAKNQNAPFIDTHTDKAYIHTWLAWQNEPGQQLHTAILKKVLNPTHPKAQVFVRWFKDLYEL